MTCHQHVESFSPCWFLYLSYCYKSVAIQIPHYGGLILLWYTAQKSISQRITNQCPIPSIISKLRESNLGVTGPWPNLILLPILSYTYLESSVSIAIYRPILYQLTIQNCFYVPNKLINSVYMIYICLY